MQLIQLYFMKNICSKIKPLHSKKLLYMIYNMMVHQK